MQILIMCLTTQNLSVRLKLNKAPSNLEALANYRSQACTNVIVYGWCKQDIKPIFFMYKTLLSLSLLFSACYHSGWMCTTPGHQLMRIYSYYSWKYVAMLGEINYTRIIICRGILLATSSWLYRLLLLIMHNLPPWFYRQLYTRLLCFK